MFNYPSIFNWKTWPFHGTARQFNIHVYRDYLKHTNNTKNVTRQCLNINYWFVQKHMVLLKWIQFNLIVLILLQYTQCSLEEQCKKCTHTWSHEKQMIFNVLFFYNSVIYCLQYCYHTINQIYLLLLNIYCTVQFNIRISNLKHLQKKNNKLNDKTDNETFTHIPTSKQITKLKIF